MRATSQEDTSARLGQRGPKTHGNRCPEWSMGREHWESGSGASAAGAPGGSGGDAPRLLRMLQRERHLRLRRGAARPGARGPQRGRQPVSPAPRPRACRTSHICTTALRVIGRLGHTHALSRAHTPGGPRRDTDRDIQTASMFLWCVFGYKENPAKHKVATASSGVLAMRRQLACQSYASTQTTSRPEGTRPLQDDRGPRHGGRRGG